MLVDTGDGIGGNGPTRNVEVEKIKVVYKTLGEGWKFQLGDEVRKIKGSEWGGRVVGFYSTEQTPCGYAIESHVYKGTVQIYPEAALELIN